jgi:hypothetical protein
MAKGLPRGKGKEVYRVGEGKGVRSFGTVSAADL